MNRFLPLYVIVLLFTGLTAATAQESIGASGGEASGSGGFVSYSIGQLFHITYTGETGSVAEGVQQPYEISVVTGIQEMAGIELIILAFPNPATDYLILRVENYDYQNLSYQLFDVNGRLIANKHLEGNQTKIDMTGLVYGVYFLRVYSVEHTDQSGILRPLQEVKTFKIIKS